MVALYRWHIANSLARLWRDRLDRVQARLQRRPAGIDAWQWRIEVRILSYLLTRYGGDPDLRPPPRRPRPLTYDRQRDPTDGPPPRSSGEIRGTVERIAEANQEAEKKLGGGGDVYIPNGFVRMLSDWFGPRP